MRRLLPAEFSDIASSHAEAIVATQGTLQVVRDLFCTRYWVRPPEFEYAIKCLMSIGEHCRKFHAFIEQSSHLPFVVVPLRLPLLIALKNVDVQVTKLFRLLASLHEVIWTTPYQPLEQKLEIQYELSNLQLNCKEVLEQMDILEQNVKHEIEKSKFEKHLYSVV